MKAILMQKYEFMMITQYVSLAKNNFFISHVFVPYTMSISIQYVFSQLISITSNLIVLLVFPHFFIFV